MHHGQPGCVEEYSFPHLSHLMTSEGISAREENMKLGESLVGLYSSIGASRLIVYNIGGSLGAD